MRFREHIRSNVIGYIALFAFAMSGTASALDGSDTVFSDDIVDGEVKTADINTNAVRSNQIQNGQVATADLGDGKVTELKLADDSVTGAKVLDGEIGIADLADGSVTGAKVLDGEIGNADLADGSVGTNKVQDGAINSAKILDDSQAGGGLGPQDLATNAVAQAEIATDGVAATEVQNDSIDAGEIVDFGLTNQDVGVLFAEVSATAVLDNHSGGVTVTRVGAVGSGQYEVDFGRNIALCTAVATVGLSGAGAPVAGEVYVADRSGNAEAVFVDTNTSAGAAADRAFRLVVVC